MRRSTFTLTISMVLAATLLGTAAGAQWWDPPAAPRPQQPAAKPKPVTGCIAASKAADLAARVRVSAPAAGKLAHGEPFEVKWTLPATGRATPVYLVGAMPDTVRFEGRYQLDAEGSMQAGPGFVALPGKARAPHGLSFAGDRTRIVIAMHDPDTPRSGSLRIKPYVAGPLAIEWAVVAVDPACRTAADKIVAMPAGRLGPFEIASGAPQIVVQDFVAPDPTLEVAAIDGSQKLVEVEVSANGRYRLEVFPRRYRVFDRTSGAKLVDRAGVKARFSPGARFVVASVGDAERTYPTNLEVIDLVAGKVVASVIGPLVAWSNGDALLVDVTRAYQTVTFFNTLVDPVLSADGNVASWTSFSPGCGTCDAWVSSNVDIDWDRLSVLRADGGVARAMGYVNLATGRKVETSSFGDEEAQPLEARLREIYGRPDVPVAIGWTGNAPLQFTHVGRGYDGYTDDDDSGALTPSAAGRRSVTELIAPRRLALADGEVLRPEDLKPIGATRGDAPPQRRRATRGLPLDDASVADDLARFGLTLSAAQPIAEIPIPVDDAAGDRDPIIRTWPAALRDEVLGANPSLQSWFAKSDFPDYAVAAWRFEAAGVHFLLLQHGEAAPTVNGVHQLRFDLLALDGPGKGAVRTLAGVSGRYSQYVGREHTIARPSLIGGKRLVVAVPGTGLAEIVALDGKSAAGLIDLSEPTVLCRFYEAAPRGLLVQANCDGQMFVFEPGRQAKPVLAGRVVDNELILYTGQGYYASTYEGAHFVHVAFPGLAGVHSFEQFAKVLERPDVIAGIVAGKPLTVAAPVIAPPPRIEASFSTAGRPEIRSRAQSDVGLAAVELHYDGRLAERRPAAGLSADIVFKVDLPPHVRSVALVAVDANGIRSRPFALAAPTSREPRTNTLHVVAIGVDDYDHLPKLKGARLDAETLVSALRAHAPYYQAIRATIRGDREVTAGSVMADLAAAVDAAGPDDTILVFFAGHGGRTADGRYFMATPATDASRLPDTAIDWQQAAGLLGKAKGRVIAVLDACHAGQTGQPPVANDGAVASLAETARAPMVVLAASKGRQESEEMPGGSGGVFTQTLAQLIGVRRRSTDADQDGVIEISELYRALRQAVDASTGGRQTPWLVRRNIVGDAPLF